MFPCATQVSLIQVGADDFDSKVPDQQREAKTLKDAIPKWLPPKSGDAKERIRRPVLQRVSQGLTFTEEVSSVTLHLFVFA